MDRVSNAFWRPPSNQRRPPAEGSLPASHPCPPSNSTARALSPNSPSLAKSHTPEELLNEFDPYELREYETSVGSFVAERTRGRQASRQASVIGAERSVASRARFPATPDNVSRANSESLMALGRQELLMREAEVNKKIVVRANNKDRVGLTSVELSYLHQQLMGINTTCTLVIGFAMASLSADLLGAMGDDGSLFCMYKSPGSALLSGSFVILSMSCICACFTIIACIQIIIFQSQRAIFSRSMTHAIDSAAGKRVNLTSRVVRMTQTLMYGDSESLSSKSASSDAPPSTTADRMERMRRAGDDTDDLEIGSFGHGSGNHSGHGGRRFSRASFAQLPSRLSSVLGGGVAGAKDRFSQAANLSHKQLILQQRLRHKLQRQATRREIREEKAKESVAIGGFTIYVGLGIALSCFFISTVLLIWIFLSPLASWRHVGVGANFTGSLTSVDGTGSEGTGSSALILTRDGKWKTRCLDPVNDADAEYMQIIGTLISTLSTSVFLFNVFTGYRLARRTMVCYTLPALLSLPDEDDMRFSGATGTGAAGDQGFEDYVDNDELPAHWRSGLDRVSTVSFRSSSTHDLSA